MARSLASLFVFLYLFSFPHPFKADSTHANPLANHTSLNFIPPTTETQDFPQTNITVNTGDFFSDSIYRGRKCKLVLFNGFEAVGRIIFLTADSLLIQTDTYEHKILIKDIKYVLKPDEDVSLRDDMENQIKEIRKEDPSRRLVSEECDILISNRILLKNVSLLIYDDSTIYAYTDNYKKEIHFKDIRKIVFKGSDGFGTGFLIGAAAGFSAGFFPLAFIKNPGHGGVGGPEVGLIVGLIFALPAGLAGGLLGVLFDTDEVYIFESGISSNKHSKIKYVISKHLKYGEQNL